MPSSLFQPPVERLTVLYDRDCGLCHWTAGQLRALDRAGKLELIPLQHAAAHPERGELTRAAAQCRLADRIHVVRDDGRIRAGGGALLEILDALPGGPLLRPWARLPGVEPTVDAIYRLIAGHRQLVSRLLRRSGRTATVCDLGH